MSDKDIIIGDKIISIRQAMKYYKDKKQCKKILGLRSSEYNILLTTLVNRLQCPTPPPQQALLQQAPLQQALLQPLIETGSNNQLFERRFFSPRDIQTQTTTGTSSNPIFTRTFDITRPDRERRYDNRL